MRCCLLAAQGLKDFVAGNAKAAWGAENQKDLLWQLPSVVVPGLLPQ